MGDTDERSLRSATRPFWFDPRFAIGMVLVVGSVLGVSFVIATVDDTVQVYAARTMLPAGTEVTAADLDIAAVRLGTAGAHYIAVDELPSDGLVITRAVAAGELVPIAAVNERATAGQTSIVVTLAGDVAGAVGPGAAVDLWAAPQLEHGRFGAPTIVVNAAEVVRVVDGGGFIGGDTGRSVELRLPTSRVAAVLQSVANADALSLVPASLTDTETAAPSSSPSPSTKSGSTELPSSETPPRDSSNSDKPTPDTSVTDDPSAKAGG